MPFISSCFLGALLFLGMISEHLAPQQTSLCRQKMTINTLLKLEFSSTTLAVYTQVAFLEGYLHSANFQRNLHGVSTAWNSALLSRNL